MKRPDINRGNYNLTRYSLDLDKYIDYLEALVKEQRRYLNTAFDESLKKNIQLLVDDLPKKKIDAKGH